MRIDRIRVDGFGRLSGWDTGDTPLGPLVVVLGPNEAGKSTLFHFLTTALYGFQPASRDRNPHVPWGLDEAGGLVRLRLDSGGCAEVERRLRSQPAGLLTHEGHTREIRNLPIPWVEHVPRAVFRQVFAVTLGDLAGLDEQTWARIQDRVVGSMGATDLRPVRQVAEELEREAGELWRPNRRGNQRVREIQSRIRELRERRRAAVERDRAVRELVAELEATRVRLIELREVRQIDRFTAERVQSLHPVRARLGRIADLRAESGPASTLAGLPPDPRERLATLAARGATLSSRRTEVAEERRDPEGVVERARSYGPAARERADEIRRFLAGTSELAAERVRVRELEEEVRGLDDTLESLSAELLGIRWDDSVEPAILAVPMSMLGEAVGRIEAARREPSTPPPSAEPGSPRRKSPWAYPLLLLLPAGVALVAWSASRDHTLGLALAGTLLAVALGWLAVGALSRLRRPRRAPAAASDPRDLQLAGSAAARQEVAALLRDVPIRIDRVEEPDARLVADLERFRRALIERQRCGRTLVATLERVSAVDLQASMLASDAGLSGHERGDALVASLSAFVVAVDRAQHEAEVAARDLVRLDKEAGKLASEWETVAAEEAALRALVARAGAGTDDPLAVVEHKLAMQRRADQLEDELERTHPDLDSLRHSIREAEDAGEPWTTDDQHLVRTRARIETVTEDIEDLASRAEGLEQKIAHARELETPDAVDSEVETLKESEARLVRERDRKWTLAQLLREADRRFREEHQPDILRRAGAYLEHLTEGRYNRLLADEASGGDIFQVVGPTLPAPIQLAPPMSTGTLEQAYLSLRLAIVDHLDQSDERLPLFVDEVFVNWDRRRMHRGLEVLVGLSEKRQLFVFTCHDEVADELVAAGAQKLELPRRT